MGTMAAAGKLVSQTARDIQVPERTLREHLECPSCDELASLARELNWTCLDLWYVVTGEKIPLKDLFEVKV